MVPKCPNVSNIIDKAAGALYGLKTIRSRGLTGESLHDVTRATLIARLIYAARLGGDSSP